MSHPSHPGLTSRASLRGALSLVLALGLAACASAPPDRFHTLGGAADPLVPAAPPAPGAAPLYVEMLAVSVPEQVQRRQMVVTASDGRIDLLEHERWVGPLEGEIGRVLSLGVTGALGAVDVFRMPYPPGPPVYRISTRVQRFDSMLDRYALVDVVWSVRQLKSNAVLTCRSVLRENAGPGYDDLVAGHRRALDRLAAQMAAAVRSLAADGRAACPGLSG
jgi:uncharacterized lipoprotein YmbA